MNPKDYKIAEEFKNRLNEIIALLDFRVFGARAHGDAAKYPKLN